MYRIEFIGIEFIMGALGCGAVILSAKYFSDEFMPKKDSSRLVKYTMPVFLMHTIVSPAARSFLLYFGIKNGFVHFTLGAFAGIFLPVLAGYLMHLTVFPELVMYPTATWKRIKKD